MAKPKQTLFVTCKWCPVKSKSCIHKSYQSRAVCEFMTEYYLKGSAVLDWRLTENGFDNEIIPILKNLWRDKVQTIGSCAGHEGIYWQAFITFYRHEQFIKYLIDNGIKVEKWKDDKYGVYCWERKDIYANAPPNEEAKIMRDKFINILSDYKKEKRL